MDLRDFQNLIRTMYYEKDVARGVSGTYMWLAEELGELASDLRQVEQLRQADPADENSKTKLAKVESNLKTEFADVIAWLATIANIVDVDLSEALAAKYGEGCPGCGNLVCDCPDAEKP
ncbi:MazG nucleotide pyrophosphohydrolase domain-containing protein [Mariniblastus fucicola]|uniref:MazG nucleotide pyrophosphohydrolase domain protein n=1 Tax=Mariniblastus fucicola TaxID=980251 RepID=A0A5B9PF91_9BACT|nr:MazG nucleotide pyrophosphohydrolase domain-containing protein [Mariniblastus fucicola]QEG25078.1 MazG nucleotide pyrophosphohydrolase domain protein [Mariniblastus fucicola]